MEGETDVKEGGLFKQVYVSNPKAADIGAQLETMLNAHPGKDRFYVAMDMPRALLEELAFILAPAKVAS